MAILNRSQVPNKDRFWKTACGTQQMVSLLPKPPTVESSGGLRARASQEPELEILTGFLNF